MTDGYERQLMGLRDKLFWRKVGGRVHCFKRLEGGGYESLCNRERIRRSGGQGCGRPPPMLRCGRCDGEEMLRRDRDESCDTSPDWTSFGDFTHLRTP